MRLYVISSFYQFINVIAIETERKKNDSDLLIIKSTIKKKFDIEKIKNENIFHNVYDWTDFTDKYCRQSKNTIEYLKNNMKKFFLALNYKKIKKTLPNINQKYDEICIFYPDYLSRIVCATFTERHTKVIFVEDGTYTYRCFDNGEKFIRKIIYKVLIKQNILEECKEVYVYRPEFLKHQQIYPFSVKKINYDFKAVKDIIINISYNNTKEMNNFHYPVIMFDQNLEYDEILFEQNLIATKIFSLVGKENFIIKIHPSAENNFYKKKILQYRDKIPFEILMTSTDIENKILISIFSTACMNPKLMTNKEPIVIFIYKIVGLEKLKFFNKNYLKLIEDLTLLYQDKTRIFVPETIEELCDYLIKWKENFDEKRKNV